MTTLWLIHIWLVCRYTINSFRDLHQIAVRVLISCFPSLNNSLVLSGQSIPLSLHPLRSTLFSHQQCVIIFERAKAQNRGKDGLIIPEVGSMSTPFFFFSLNSKISSMMQYVLSSGLFTRSALVSSDQPVVHCQQAFTARAPCLLWFRSVLLANRW